MRPPCGSRTNPGHKKVKSPLPNSPEQLIVTMQAWERALRPEVMASVRLGLMVLPIKLQDRLVGRRLEGKDLTPKAQHEYDELSLLIVGDSSAAGVGVRTQHDALAGHLTRTLALELGKFNITANYVCPGAIYSGMTRTNFDNPEIRAVWEKKAALRRLGQPIDIARGALLLASDEADFITGHELVVDGGLTLRT